jgi:cytochrome b subunit of formate dehydrogenase
MGKRINEAFLNRFVELDKLCCHKFGVMVGGVNEYMKNLNNIRLAPNRDEVLRNLVRYANIHTVMGANLRKNYGIVKSDVKWLTRFKKDVQKKRDPITQYLRKARRFAFRKKLWRGIFVTTFILLIVACVALYFALTK